MPPDGENPLEKALKGDVTAGYAAWAATTPADFPPEAIEWARRAFIDIVACVIPGALDPAAAKVRAVATAWGHGPCVVVGAAHGLSAPNAALVNGVAAHALDFDDNFDPAKAHITAVLAPALLAQADARGMSGRKVLEAYIVGVEIAARVGQGLNPVHRNRGWHATSTIGTVAAAAAVGRLIGLDQVRLRHAINMSTSFAGGFMSQFGSMTKPLHAGKAASAGVMCALFAEAGLTAGDETLTGRTGMAQLMVGPDLDSLCDRRAFTSEHGQTLRFETGGLGRPLAILDYGLKVKRYPTCASTHRALDGMITLLSRHRFVPADVARVEVAAPLTHFNNLMYTNPTTASEAKFSMEYCLAVALLRGGVGLMDFMPEALADPAVRAIMPKIDRRPVDKSESEYPTRIVIALASGDVHSIEVDAPKGRADNPLSEAELWQKFRLCCQGMFDAAQIDAITAALNDFAGPGAASALTASLRFAAN